MQEQLDMKTLTKLLMPQLQQKMKSWWHIHHQPNDQEWHENKSAVTAL